MAKVVERVVWVDASSAASSDLLLAALVDAGVPIGVMAEAIEKVAVGGRLHEARVRRDGASATSCRVEVEDIEEQRTWREIEVLLAGAGLHEDVRALAHDVLARLAEAESRVQGRAAEDVHLHDVGPQAIAEVVGVCAGLVHLRARRLGVSPGPSALESCTPIGAALLTALADDWGPQPAMTVSDMGVGAAWGGSEEHLLRLVVGDSEPGRNEKLGES